MRQLDALGNLIERTFDEVEAHAASPYRAVLLGVALALGTIVVGLAALFILLKLLTVLF